MSLLTALLALWAALFVAALVMLARAASRPETETDRALARADIDADSRRRHPSRRPLP